MIVYNYFVQNYATCQQVVHLMIKKSEGSLWSYQRKNSQLDGDNYLILWCIQKIHFLKVIVYLHIILGRDLFMTPQRTVWNSSVCSNQGGRLYGGSWITDSKELVSLLEQNYTEGGWINIRSLYGPRWINGRTFG